MSFSFCISSKINIIKNSALNHFTVQSVIKKTVHPNSRHLHNKFSSYCNLLWQKSEFCHSNQTLKSQRCLSCFSSNQIWANKYTGLLGYINQPLNNLIRSYMKIHYIDGPAPETCKKNLRYKVHYPEDGKYTIKPLPMTKLGGRDPETGRLIFGKIGGGAKRRYRWVMFNRLPPGSQDPLIEKVIHVQYDPNRTARIALVGHDDQLRFIIATTSMQKGDIITSTRQLPKMPIRPKEGDAHPLGALPVGTKVCCIEKLPQTAGSLKISAGSSADIVKRLGNRMILRVDKHLEFALDQNCLATVGQVSLPKGKPRRPIGSAQRLRWLGIRPGSGLFQKKTSRFGFRRKKKKLEFVEPRKEPLPVLKLTLLTEQHRRKITPSTHRVS